MLLSMDTMCLAGHWLCSLYIFIFPSITEEKLHMSSASGIVLENSLGWMHEGLNPYACTWAIKAERKQKFINIS